MKKKKRLGMVGIALVGVILATSVPGVYSSTSAATVVAPKVPYDPLNPLTSKEIDSVTYLLKHSPNYASDMRFSEINLKEPDKSKVWKWVTGSAVFKKNAANKLPRQASFVITQKRKVFEGVVDLDKKQIVEWKENTTGGYYYNDQEASEIASEVVKKNPEYLAALKKRGITDLSNVFIYGLPAGYYGPNDTDPTKRINKFETIILSDGSSIELLVNNLLVTVDIDEKKVLKVEDDGVVPIPLFDEGYKKGDKKSKREPAKPIVITQPKGANYHIEGQQISWQGWKFHVRLDPRRGPIISAATFNDHGADRKVLYSGGLGGMTVPYGDPGLNWYFKTYMDAGEYGMGRLGRPLLVGADVPDNTSFIDATLSDFQGKPYTLPKVIGVFERYADSDWTHKEYDGTIGARARYELVVRFISTVGNYDYTFDYVFQQNGNIKIDVGASGYEANKSAITDKVNSSQDQYIDPNNAEIRNGTLVAKNIVAVLHQHLYSFRLDMDVDGQKNTVLEIAPKAVPTTDNAYRKSEMILEEKTYHTELEAAQKFDPSKILLVTNPAVKNKMGYLSGYQIIANSGGTHPFAQDPLFTDDDYLMQRAGYLKKHIWITPYKENEIYPEGKYINQNPKDTGLGSWAQQDRNIYNEDDVVWVTTGTTHVPRSEEWPMMSTEWVSMLLKPFNFLDRTPTLDLPKPANSAY